MDTEHRDALTNKQKTTEASTASVRVMESDREEQEEQREEQEEEQREEQEVEQREEQEEQREEQEEEQRTLINPHVSPPLELLSSSYIMNSPDENRLLMLADSFQRQFSILFPDRRPLLLHPLNEFGVQKFVSTSLRPSPTVHPELSTWRGCASFVAGFLSLDPLEPPTELPRTLRSSTCVLRCRRASSFECASLLCSLLLGGGYDAFCVSGYAVRESCDQDRSLQRCPLLDTQLQPAVQQQQSSRKYSLRPVEEPFSRFLNRQHKKKQEEDEEASLQRRQHEGEQRPVDVLRGLRVHCWVLVLSGRRGVQQNFFIDPLSGDALSTDTDHFLGIESVWNHLNYYINLQHCRGRCADLVLDLQDLNLWEPLLFHRNQLTSDIIRRKENLITESQGEEPGALEMPRSCIMSISISEQDLKSRWPGGTQLIRYRRSQLQRFSEAQRPDGLTARLTTYRDLDCSEVAEVKEWYQHRKDHLEEREVGEVNGVTEVTERFRTGRHAHLQRHSYRPLTSEHQMLFGSGRHDDVVLRLLSPAEMTETYEGTDFLFQRRIEFSDNESGSGGKKAELQKVVERFHRNSSKSADQDVAERVFLVPEKRIKLTYHSDRHRFIPTRRTFVVPQDATERQKAQHFTADLVSGFQVDTPTEPPGTRTLYRMLVELMQDQEGINGRVQDAVREVKELVSCREGEEQRVELHRGTEAERARQHKQELERLAAEEEQWRCRQEEDILSPLLLRLDCSEPLSPAEARQVHRDCLSQFKDRLLDQATLIQERYTQEIKELQSNQNLSPDQDQNQNQDYCSQKALQLWASQTRLNMYTQSSQDRYNSLDQRLRQDPRLRPHLHS